MPLPSKTDLQTLDIAYLGAPFVQVEAKPLATTTLDVAYLGAPFVGASSSFLVWVRVSGVWKQATALYTCVGGVWKSVTTVSTRVSGIWKS